jgi:RND family efflux transporter MFP subunit
MNMTEKRILLRSLRRESNKPIQSGQQRRPWRVEFIVPICALAAWLFAQLIAPNVEVDFSDRTDNLDTSQVVQATTAPLAGGDLTESARVILQANGYIAASRSATVSARTTSVVDAVYVEEGDAVSKGTLLARLDDRVKRAEYEFATYQHAAALARMAEVKTELAASERRRARVSTLADANLVSVSELDDVTTQVEAFKARLATANADVRTAQAQVRVHQTALDNFLIRAPFDGVITQRSAQPGEIVSPISAGGGFTRTGIATLVDLGSLELEVEVNENYIGAVVIDHPVEVTLSAYPDTVYAGKVITIIPRGDRNKGTVKVRVKLTDADSRVLPDMGARVDFLTT